MTHKAALDQVLAVTLMGGGVSESSSLPSEPLLSEPLPESDESSEEDELLSASESSSDVSCAFMAGSSD